MPDQPYTWVQWLQSFAFAVPLETRRSALNPHLEVVLQNGRLLLNAAQTNYSYGSLERAFADCFVEIGLSQRKLNSCLLLGFGAGSVARLVHSSHPDCQITGVEADEAVVELYQKYFLQQSKNVQLIVNEAFNHLQGSDTRYDLILVDVFQDIAVPGHLDTEPMLEELRRALNPGGLLVWNRLLAPPPARAATQAFEPRVQMYFPGLRTYDTLSNRFWIAERTSA